MGQEIERKFLVQGGSWRTNTGELIHQGYLHNEKTGIVRIRTKGDKAFLTIKGQRTGITSSEFEYDIPVDDACKILDELCQKPLIEKIRHEIHVDDIKWEIDEFLKENTRLIVAEIELENTNQKFTKPDWLGIEVSNDVRYLNANLIKNPYIQWSNDQ